MINAVNTGLAGQRKFDTAQSAQNEDLVYPSLTPQQKQGLFNKIGDIYSKTILFWDQKDKVPKVCHAHTHMHSMSVNSIMDHSDRSFPLRIGISDISWWSLSSLIDKTTGRQVCQCCGDEGINSYTQTLDSVLK